jgi:Rieske Fe-S protein
VANTSPGVVDALTYGWAAQDNDTTDQIPYVGRFPRAERVWVATGFGGWGMSNGIMAARLLADLITGEKPAWTDLYDPSRLHPVVEAASFLRANMAVAGHVVGDRLRPTAHDSHDLARGTGAVIRDGGERKAVYRDDYGAVQAVSAVCTHRGCIVSFNDAERTWDCPCHGSRFNPDGSVLHGPATRSLEPRHPPG